MARSAAGAGPRQLILLGALAFAGAAAAAQPAPAPAPNAPRGTPAAGNTTAQTAARKPPPAGAAHGKGDAPDAAVLEYLGEFDDAGDGLDAMGLAGDDADTPKPAQGGRR